MTSMDILKVNEFSRTPTNLPTHTFQRGFTEGKVNNLFIFSVIFLLLSLFPKSLNFIFCLVLFFSSQRSYELLKGKEFNITLIKKTKNQTDKSKQTKNFNSHNSLLSLPKSED